MLVFERSIANVALGISLLWLIGCAGTAERPVEQLARAEANITQAEQSGAREHSPLELDLARQKLNQAQSAAEDNDNEEARRLAEQAAVDAELAAAQARAAEAERAAAALAESLATLRREAAR
jgi:hypothetical protein